MVNLETLKGRMKTPVRLASTKFAGIETPAAKRMSYGPWLLNPYDFQTEMIIITGLTVEKWHAMEGKMLCRLSFFKKGMTNPGYVNLPADFQVEEVRNVESRILMNEYNEFLLKNLTNSLGHYCHIGSDPEIFVVDGKGEMIPSFNFLGSKENPSFANGTARSRHNLPIYWDGFQAEFETEANTCLGWHSDSIRYQLNNLLILAQKYNKDAKLSTKTTFDISPELLLNSKPEHVQFGCMPSFNAYGLKGVGKEGKDVPFRSAGGHIHFGLNNASQDKLDERRAVRMVKALDAILGVGCVSMFASFDEPRRREMYGLAGEYRLPKHGLEYRTLSNAWLCHPLITNIVFDISRKAMVFGDKGLLNTWKCEEKETIRIIQECDVEAARKVLKQNEDLFKAIIGAAYRITPGEDAPYKKGVDQMIFDIFMNGVESAIANPHDMTNNWCLIGSNKMWVDHCNVEGSNVVSAQKIIIKQKKKVV